MNKYFTQPNLKIKLQVVLQLRKYNSYVYKIWVSILHSILKPDKHYANMIIHRNTSHIFSIFPQLIIPNTWSGRKTTDPRQTTPTTAGKPRVGNEIPYNYVLLKKSQFSLQIRYTIFRHICSTTTLHNEQIDTTPTPLEFGKKPPREKEKKFTRNPKRNPKNQNDERIQPRSKPTAN